MSSLAPPNFFAARVLVVESDRARRERAVERLARRGFVVLGAESNTEALSFIDQEIDVVVFDFAMFGRGGIDLISEWKRRKGKTKILVCVDLEPWQELSDIFTRGANVFPGGLTQITLLVLFIQFALNRDSESFDPSKNIPTGYTIESAKALMEQGKQEHEQGKLTWAAQAWETAEKKLREKIRKRMDRRYGLSP